MIESWSDVIMGMVTGIGGTIIAVILFCMIRMNLKFMIWNKVREHEEEYHAKEIKEREKNE